MTSTRRSFPVLARAWLDTPIGARPLWTWPLVPLCAFVSLFVALEAWRRRARDDAVRALRAVAPRGAFVPGTSDGLVEPGERLDPLDPIDLVCVGNVVVGGSGKSPLVRAFLEPALQMGRTVAVVSRGYGGTGGEICARASDLPVAIDPLSDEVREHVELLRLSCGDSALERLWVVQGARRRDGLDRLRAALSQASSLARGPRGRVLAVMDDGLQHFAVRPRVRVCVWPLDTYDRAPKAALPLGPYREGFFRGFDRFLSRFDVHVWSRLPSHADSATRAGAIAAIERRRADAGSTIPHLLAVASASWLEGPMSDEARQSLALAFAAGRLGVLCGLARPEEFRASVAAALAEAFAHPVDPAAIPAAFLPDHGALDARADALLSSCEVLVTSAKDWFRWRGDARLEARWHRGQLRVLCVKVLLEDTRNARVGALELLGTLEDPA